jgi:hypothetical protein
MQQPQDGAELAEADDEKERGEQGSRPRNGRVAATGEAPRKRGDDITGYGAVVRR